MIYIEDYEFQVDDQGRASVQVVLRLKHTSPSHARAFTGAIVDTASGFLKRRSDPPEIPKTHYESGGEALDREIRILRPQTDGPCAHCARYGEGWVDQIEGMPTMELVVKISDIRGKFPNTGLPEYREVNMMPRQDLIEHLKRVAGSDVVAYCKYPYDDGDCPHLDNPDIVCPVRDACIALSKPAPTGSEPESEPKPAPKQTRRGYWSWTDKERDAIADAGSPTMAVDLYRAAYPDVDRTDKSIKSQYGKIQSRRLKQRAAESVRRETPSSPDFVGDDMPVTQYEEDPLEDLETAGDRWVGARVRILEPRDLAGRCGEVIGQLPWPDMQVLVALDESSERVWISTDAVVRE